MRAVAMRKGALVLTDMPQPEPGPGQLLVEPIAVGVCGGDLNALEHADDFVEASRRSGTDTFAFDPSRDVVFGHEFTSRVVEVGAAVDGVRPGDLLLNLPLVIDRAGTARCVGYATDYPGGLAERVVVQAAGQIPIPEGVSPYLPAMTDPLATGLNGVVRSKIGRPHGAVVTGCGPVGLGAVWELAHRGIWPLVASDPSPVRRRLAAEFGAHTVVDPDEADPVAAWRDLAAPDQVLYVYEASGKPGVVAGLLYAVPPFTRITVVGACMTDDVIRPLVAIYKNATLEFCLGGTAEIGYQFEQTFRHIAAGRLPAGRLLTGYAGLEGVPEVFERLRPGDFHDIEHVKILIRHDLAGPGIRAPSSG
jgi:threonine dehydrogenase-like Zn-dependent dehydrogenase